MLFHDSTFTAEQDRYIQVSIIIIIIVYIQLFSMAKTDSEFTIRIS